MSLQLEPGPDHPITITPSAKSVRIRWNGHVVAQTKRALDLKEATYPVVVYVPRDDADMRFFAKTAKSTHCPYKGDASYFTLKDKTDEAPDAVWSYEDPYLAMARIADHLAFYPHQVSFEYD
jgi:uncharacterized protein (DUF427 family)